MATAAFMVRQAGPHVSVQDAGRPGRMRVGVPASGPMDRTSFAIANAAIGNPAGAAGIEISMGGLTLECIEGQVTLAIAGGGFQVDIDQDSFGSWSIATVRAGSKVSVKPGPWGSWTYLCFAGRLRTERWLGSAATHSQSGFGGGHIRAGQQLTIDDAEVRPDRCGEIPCPVFSRPRTSLRVVLGPQERFFTDDTTHILFAAPYTLTSAYDRMGVRLAGPSLRPSAKLDMPSEAIVRGSVQVAGDGMPTVLLADHQTTGGYPKIATVISGDTDGLVQLRSRSQAIFERTSPEDAIEIARSRHATQQRFLERLLGRGRPSFGDDERT